MTELPMGWECFPLKDVAFNLDSIRIPINAKERAERIAGKSGEQLFPYYGATGQVGEIDGYLFEGEHVLIGEDGAPFLEPTRDKAFVVNGRFWVNNHAHILKAHGSNRFLAYYLNSISYADHVTGTTRLKLTKAALEAIPVTLPPLPEQHRIVARIEELFSELDASVESLNRARALLGLYRQSLLKAAFLGKLTADWRAANPDKLETPETLLSRIRKEREDWYRREMEEWRERCRAWEQSGMLGPRPSGPDTYAPLVPLLSDELAKLPALPYGWAFTRLSEVAAVGSGMSVSKGRELVDPIEVSYLRVANVQRGHLDLDVLKTMPVEKSQVASLALRVHDVLFNEGGDRDKLGRGWVWEEAVDPCITQNHVFRATLFRPSEAAAKLLSHWGNSHGQDYFEKGGKQTTNLASINKTVLKALPVPVIPYDEANELFARLESALSAIDTTESEITTALTRIEALRQSILKRAFSGRLVPQDPTDEPASALLARLKPASPAHARGRRKRA